MIKLITAGLAGLALAGMVATSAPASAAVTTPARPVAVHPAFTAAGHSGHCAWRVRGKHEFITYAYLRMVRDTCSDPQLRLRIAGKCSVAGWIDGNWINDNRQLTSISCPAGQGYFTIVLDYQYWWPKSAKDRHGHPRGKVHQITLE